MKQITLAAAAMLLMIVLAAAPAAAQHSHPQRHASKSHLGKTTKITLLGFSDYHSHALPFYSEERTDQGGIARAFGYMKREKQRGAVVFSGGDMVNKGSPAWSDKFRCVEWPWLNGVVDDMAFGNHDADYGADEFARCRARVTHPILSANTDGFQRYDVLTRRGIRLGVFAVAGPDFSSLVKAAPFRYSDRIDAARDVVKTLREVEHVDAIILIGHEHESDDFALARAVPGIDIILGSHSHLKREWQQIAGTKTWFLSPFQYLTYISRVELTFEGHVLQSAHGSLVPVNASMPVDKVIAARVSALQHELESDPQYAALFAPIGRLEHPLSVDALGAFAVDAMRVSAKADLALSTKSSFRQPLPAGPLTMELLRMAMPYDNEIVLVTLGSVELSKLLAKGAESESYLAGTIEEGKTYRVATTDYFAGVAKLTAEKTGLHVRDEVRKALREGVAR
ncbi:MAG: 5'-nucleotidase C-terminal domain-containing protein [Acidobacteriota bacterium]